MKIVHFTDLHLRGVNNNPKWREGNYHMDLLAKLEWLVQVVNKARPDLLTFGGDFVNSPSVSIGTVNAALAILDQIDPSVDCLFAFGQHDMYGHNPSTLSSSSASLLSWHFYGKPSVEPIFEAREGRSLVVNHHVGLEESLADLPWCEETRADIVLVHAMIVPKEVPWPHVLIDDIRINTDLILCGDYHPGFPPTERNGTWFINPGAMARQSITEANRTPQIAAIDTDKLKDGNGVKYVAIPHGAADETFDMDSFEESTKQRTTPTGEYALQLAEIIEDGRSSWESLFNSVEDAYPEEIIQEARTRCQKVTEQQTSPK